MHRVRKTKYHSLRQIEKMVKNLKEKFDGCGNVQTLTTLTTTYWISDGDDSFGWFDTWEELQAEYQKLMKGG